MLVAALLAPAAARATAKYRVFQDLSVSGPFSGKVFLAIDDEDTQRERQVQAAPCLRVQPDGSGEL